MKLGRWHYDLALSLIASTAYRVVSREAAEKRIGTGLSPEKAQELMPKAWFDAWADATFATDPKGEGKTVRVPNDKTGFSAGHLDCQMRPTGDGCVELQSSPALRMPSRKCGIARGVYGTYRSIHSIEMFG